jgi:hypothetical protein
MVVAQTLVLEAAAGLVQTPGCVAYEWKCVDNSHLGGV